MNEKEALKWLATRMPVGDDCYVMDWGESHLLLTTDMLHQTTDFPPGTTGYTTGWRSVAVSLSDIAAMGGEPKALVIAYGNSQFDLNSLEKFIEGAEAVCDKYGTRIVGGDLDSHEELTVVTSALGEVKIPATRKGAQPGELVAVTGDLGRTAAALDLFEKGRDEKANELFQFTPRVEQGKKLASLASSMMDISDGLARSLHQLAEVNDVGFRVTADKIPYAPLLDELTGSEEEKEKLGLFTGEDYELLFTAPEKHEFDLAKYGSTVIGKVTEEGVDIVRGREVSPLEDEGYVH
ncbi:thiamine-phosphate kinase [Candidatus Bipolaricaulota bacterium]|nr:thiamine-phosphate kinase [Candidatus Bipolaricaulota bacterium]